MIILLRPRRSASTAALNLLCHQPNAVDAAVDLFIHHSLDVRDGLIQSAGLRRQKHAGVTSQFSTVTRLTQSLRGHLPGGRAAGTDAPTKCQRVCTSNLITTTTVALRRVKMTEE